MGRIMVSQNPNNGNGNGHGPPDDGGDKGGSTYSKGHMAYLQRYLNHADANLDQMGEIALFAQTVMDDPDAKVRDRLRASELLKSLADKGVDIAVVIDRMQRLDRGEPTDSHQVTITDCIKRATEAEELTRG